MIQLIFNICRIQRNAASASRGQTSGSSSSRSEPRAAYSSDVSIWSSDRLSEVFLSQSTTRNGRHRKTPSRVDESLESLVSKLMQVALVFNLAVGTKKKPVLFPVNRSRAVRYQFLNTNSSGFSTER